DWQSSLATSLQPAPEHAFPPELSNRLLPLLSPSTGLLERLRDKDIIFVGAGKGRAMAGIQQYLEKYGEIRSFTGVDKKDGGNPLGFLTGYDPTHTVFIKNEGVPGHELPVPYITPMQLF